MLLHTQRVIYRYGVKMPDLTHEQVNQYIGLLRATGELPRASELTDGLRQDIVKYLGSLTGSYDIFAYEVGKTDNRQDVFDYFRRQQTNESHTVRRIQDIANDLDKRPDEVYRAITPLVGLVYMRPMKWQSNGDYVDCYQPVVRYLGKKFDAIQQANNISIPPKAQAIMTACARHVYEKSDFEMTNGLEAIYAPELINILPEGTDVRISIETDPDFGFMEVVLQTAHDLSSSIWDELEEACRVQTRAIINRMTYDPDDRTLIGSEHLSQVVRKVASSEPCSCTDKHCVHFIVLSSNDAAGLFNRL